MPFLVSVKNFFMRTLPGVLWNVVALFAYLHSAAWTAMREPILRMLNADDAVKDDLTRTWRDSMQLQLNVVAVTSTLVGSVVTTTLAWPAISSSDRTSQPTGYSSWPVRWLWYMTLIFAITSTVSAMQLAIFLHRLSSYPDGLVKIRNLLGQQVGLMATANPPHYNIRGAQLVIWQIPMMLLNGSVYSFLAGLVWLIYDGADFSRGWESRDTKIFALSAPGIAFCILCYSMLNIGSYGRLPSL